MIDLRDAGGSVTVTLNQREPPKIDGHFYSAGRYRFDQTGTVSISNQGTDGHVIIDAVRWLPSK